LALDGLSRREHFTGDEDRVFCPPTGWAVDGSEVRRAFYAALKAAGPGRLREKDDPIVFHDLRHTFGTLAVKTWDLRKVQGYMGHADISTTQLYMHHQPKATDADELSRAVAAAMTGAAMTGAAMTGAEMSSAVEAGPTR
jgi:integrase